MIRTLVQGTALILTIEAAYFLVRGSLVLSVTAIAELSETKWDHSLEIARSLTTQQADAWVGIVLLLIGFTLQMVNALWPLRYVDFEVSYVGWLGVLLISADLDELLDLSARIAVMCDGRIVGIVRPSETDEKQLGAMMLGSEPLP